MMAGVAVLMMMWLTVFVDETMSLDNTNVMTEMLQQRLASADYNSRIRPGADGDAVIVYINIEVQDISSISEVNMEYSMSLFLTQIWTDNRLAFPEFSRNLTLNYNLLSQIWAPDLFVRNLKSGLFQNITVPNLLLSLSPDGTMFFSQRLTLTLVCGMQLERYPMDNQTCTIEFGSYGYTVVDIIFLWRLDAPAVVMDYNISLPEYNIDNISSLVCVHSGIGQKPCIRASFHLSRRIRAYVLSTYLPQLLVVVVSWVSLWMDPCSAPARTSLGITTVLAMITTQGYGQNGMPSGSITKAIDVWMLTCLVFVFAAFVEFSIVNTLVRRQKALKALKAKSCPSGDGTSLATQSDKDKSKRVNRVKSYFNHFREAPAEAIEKTCRVMFPLTFLIFNVVYWPYYTFSMTPAPN